MNVFIFTCLFAPSLFHSFTYEISFFLIKAWKPVLVLSRAPGLGTRDLDASSSFVAVSQII